MTNKIFVGNYKGGVGKTTFTYNMGCILRERGYSVLLIDLDPQSSLSEVCFNRVGNGRFTELKDEETFNNVVKVYHDALKDNIRFHYDRGIERLVKDNGNVQFIPSSYLFKDGGLDIQCLNMDKEICDICIIKYFIEDAELDKKFDYIIFDCPPSNNVITLSAFLASDYYIIPTIMDYISTRGISHYKELLDDFYNTYVENKKEVIDAAIGIRPKLLGVFESRKKGNTDTSKFRNTINKDYYLFETIISDYKEVSESLETGERSNRTNQYEELVNEIEERIRRYR